MGSSQSSFIVSVITKVLRSAFSNQRMVTVSEDIPTSPGPVKVVKSKIRVSHLFSALGKMGL